jgi:hypothetical protein
MTHKRSVVLFLVSCCLVLASRAQAQGVSGFIPSSRTVDWTHAGIPGGIPSANWPIYKTLSPGGTSDDSVAIQNAINAAPAGSVVVLNAGTYKLHRVSTVCSGKADDFGSGVYEAGLCLTDKSVVLRGAGPDKTILQYGDGANFISMGQTYLSAVNVVFIPITSGSTKGSTQVTLQSVSGLGVGTFLVITENNPTDTDGNPLVDTTGYTGSCSNCGHGLTNNQISQIDKITAVTGNTVTLETPLYFGYGNSPRAFKLPMIQSVGLENLRLQPTASSGTGIVFKNINLEACAYCWVHDVESDMTVDRANIYLSDVYASEISDNYLNDGYSHNSGETYMVYTEFRNSQNLIQNNIMNLSRHSTPMSGGSGNVFAYNYILNSHMGEYPNSLADRQAHAAHPFMNLWEGNITSNLELDYAHGSSSHNTLFRNHVNLTANNPSTGTPMTGALYAVNVEYYNNYENVIGNVIGPYGLPCTARAYEINADASQTASIYRLGYFDDGGTSSPNAALSAKVTQTILRGGNWDCTTNAVIWSSNTPSGSLASTYLSQQTLPASLYLSAKPAWFTAANAAWPPIDPIASTKVSKIPAQICFEAGPNTGAPFKPLSCYAAVAGGTPPQPPTNLTAIVN